MTLLLTPYLRSRWPVLLIAAVFIAFKLPHLFYPFYWDESVPYAAGIMRFYESGGPSLLPASLDPSYSRGHPLFFHCGAVIWMKLFGTSHAAMHSWPLFLSVLFLFVIYEAGRQLFNQRVAVLATLLTATQVMFFVQSTFLLTDLPVALFCFAALWLYASERYLAAGILLTVAFYTKESALFAGFVMGLDAFIALFDRKRPIGRRWAGFFAVLVPALLIGVFFLVQKKQNGWYLFPDHEGYIDIGLMTVLEKLRAGFSVVFRNDHKSWVYAGLLGVAAATLVFRGKIVHAVPVAVLLVLAAFARYYRELQPAWISLALFIAGFVLLVWWPFRIKGLSAQGRRMAYLLAACSLSFMLLSAMNFYSNRYFMLPLVLMLFYAAVWMDKLGAAWRPKASLAFVPLILAAGILGFRHSTGKGDTQLGAYTGMEVQQKLVGFLEDNKLHDRALAVGGYLDAIHLKDRYAGFLRSEKEFSDVRWDLDSRTEYVVFSSIEEPDNRHEYIRNHALYRKVFRYEASPELWAEVYERVR